MENKCLVLHDMMDISFQAGKCILHRDSLCIQLVLSLAQFDMFLEEVVKRLLAFESIVATDKPHNL